MSEQETAPKTRIQFLRDAFEGMKGRRPTSDAELNQWLATDEGKAATLFDDTTVSPWGERGDRSPPLSFMPSQRRFPPPWSVEDTDSKAAEGVTTTALPSSPYVPCIHSRASRGVGTAMGNRWSD